MADNGGLANRQLGNYRIVTPLNNGSFGSVYMGEHVIFANEPAVAIKVLHTFLSAPQECEVFLQEALLLKKLSHPHILPIIDAGVQDNIAYIVTEFASHGSLRDQLDLQPGQPLSLDIALAILMQIGQALQYAHQQHIVHRDLKPANILFNAQGEALLADFGLAAVLDHTGTQQRDPGGTPAYMAPEQFEGIVSTKSDQYTLACIAYEMLTGIHPFASAHQSIEAVWYQHAKVQPTPPTQFNPEIPRHVERAILMALSKQRADRYVDIDAFLAALQEVPDPQNEAYYEQLAACEQAIVLEPDNAELYKQKGNLLCALKHYEQAVVVYEQALFLNPNLAVAYNNMGYALCLLKRYEEALEVLEQALRLDDTYAVAYTNRGNALCQLERYEDALEALEQAIRLDPELASAYNHKGHVLCALGCYERALEAYEQAIRLNPTLAVAYSGRGRALHYLKRDGALEAYGQAIQLDPGSVTAYIGKGQVLSEAGLFEEALQVYERAQLLQPEDAAMYNWKGDVLFELQRYDEALVAYEHALHLDPDLNVTARMRETLVQLGSTNKVATMPHVRPLSPSQGESANVPETPREVVESPHEHIETLATIPTPQAERPGQFARRPWYAAQSAPPPIPHQPRLTRRFEEA